MFETVEYIDAHTDYETYWIAGEYRIDLPKRPPLKDIVNYGLPIEKQKFKRTQYNVGGKMMDACDLTKKYWKLLSKDQQKHIESQEWDRRINGLWIYIKGRTIWIPPNMYYFLNYWTFKDGSKPYFWDSQLQSFMLSNWAFHHEFILGKNKVKGRRGGGTAEENSNLLHYCTLYRGSYGGIMNKNENEAFKINFSPIVHTLLNLPVFFLPKRSGQEKPAKEITFSPASAMLTKKGQEDDRDDYSNNGYLNSVIDFMATSVIGYDGNTMTYEICDELFKWKNVSPRQAIAKQSECIKKGGIKNHKKDEFGNILYYKGLMSNLSTVEEISDNQFDEVRMVWEASDPKTATTGSISASNCIRYFEPFYFGLDGYMDDWGFSDTERAIKVFREKEEIIRSTEGNKAAIDFRRLYPETIDHALLPSGTRCVFNIDILSKARENYYNVLPDSWKPVNGKLVWVEKFKSVEWIPMPNETIVAKARWRSSYIPPAHIKNNIIQNGHHFYPGNKGITGMGVDPIEYDKNETSEGSKLSNGSIRAKLELDMTIDGNKFDDEGNPKDNGFGFETNRTIMTYCYRPDDAEEFWDDALKTAVYLGCPVLMEATSKGMKNYFIDNGFGHFLVDFDGKPISKENYKTIGWKPSKQAKDQQFETTDNYISRYGLAERHIECIDDLLIVNKENLTHHDMSAAYTIDEVRSMLLKRLFVKPPDRPQQKIQIRRRIISPGKLSPSWQ